MIPLTLHVELACLRVDLLSLRTIFKRFGTDGLPYKVCIWFRNFCFIIVQSFHCVLMLRNVDELYLCNINRLDIPEEVHLIYGYRSESNTVMVMS